MAKKMDMPPPDAIIMAVKAKKAKDEPKEMDQGDSMDEDAVLKDIAADILDSVAKKDAESLKECLKEFFECCDSHPHDEYEGK